MESNNTQSAIEAGKQMFKPQVVEAGGIPHLVHHQQANVKSMEEFLEKPIHLKERVVLHDAASFIEYYNNFANDDSHIFVDLENAKFKAVIDYHKDTDDPRHGHHTASFTCPKTPEWSKWLLNNGDKMEQENFALFIEDNLNEITNPTGGEMLEIASTLKAKNNVSFASAIRLDNGQTQFSYRENIDAQAGVNGQFSIPEKIQLALQPFQGSETYQVEARFRYRIVKQGSETGKLVMWYDIIRPHRILEDAVKDTFEKIKKGKKAGFILMGDCPR